MPNRKQIIAITVLGIVALMLGCMSQPNHPSSHLEEKDIVGTYTLKSGLSSFRRFFLADGTAEYYQNGKKRNENPKWSLVQNEIHIKHTDNYVYVYRINPDNSMTYIATIRADGKRRDIPKEQQTDTWKKIK